MLVTHSSSRKPSDRDLESIYRARAGRAIVALLFLCRAPAPPSPCSRSSLIPPEQNRRGKLPGEVIGAAPHSVLDTALNSVFNTVQAVFPTRHPVPLLLGCGMNQRMSSSKSCQRAFYSLVKALYELSSAS